MNDVKARYMIELLAIRTGLRADFINGCLERDKFSEPVDRRCSGLESDILFLHRKLDTLVEALGYEFVNEPSRLVVRKKK